MLPFTQKELTLVLTETRAEDYVVQKLMVKLLSDSLKKNFPDGLVIFNKREQVELLVTSFYLHKYGNEDIHQIAGHVEKPDLKGDLALFGHDGFSRSETSVLIRGTETVVVGEDNSKKGLAETMRHVTSQPQYADGFIKFEISPVHKLLLCADVCEFVRMLDAFHLGDVVQQAPAKTLVTNGIYYTLRLLTDRNPFSVGEAVRVIGQYAPSVDAVGNIVDCSVSYGRNMNNKVAQLHSSDLFTYEEMLKRALDEPAFTSSPKKREEPSEYFQGFLEELRAEANSH